MRDLLIKLALLLASSGLAAWLRMFDQTLFLQSWENLIGKPVRFWIAALLASPLFELLYLWPAYLMAGGFYLLVSKVKYNNKMGLIGATILGTIVGSGVFLIVSISNREWIMRPSLHNLKLLIIYTIVGTLYGCSYYYFIIRRRRTTVT